MLGHYLANSRRPYQVDFQNRDFNKLVDELLWPASGVFAAPARRNAAQFPALNVWESENAYYVEAEVPGLTMENIELTITGKELSIKGERSEMEKEGSYHRRERGTGTFSRMVHLPTDVDTAAVEALLKNGVLTIKLLKAASALPRKIAVQG